MVRSEGVPRRAEGESSSLSRRQSRRCAGVGHLGDGSDIACSETRDGFLVHEMQIGQHLHPRVERLSIRQPVAV